MADLHAPHGLPVDLLRLVLRAVLGEQQRDAFCLIRDLQSFQLVCKTWRDAAATTPLHLNTDYLPDLPMAAIRWLQRMTIADLQVSPNVPINKVLTHPDFAARNKWVLQRLWGAQLVGAPGRWPQFRHFPCLHTLELTADVAMAADGDLQHFESRVVSPLTALKHLSLVHFVSADLSRLPPSLETLHAEIFTLLPLQLPPALRLQELDLQCSRLLVDWAQLCSQVEKLIAIEAPCVDVLAVEGAGSLFRQVAAGFNQGVVLEVELVAQEVALVWLGGGADERGRQALPRQIPEQDYMPDIQESMHLVTLAADFQVNDYRQFGCVYNPDDIQPNEELGMSDGITVRLYRNVPGTPQVLGFAYGLSEEQAGYLLSEAQVEGLALEAVDPSETERVLANEEFRRRCAGSLKWLQGLDLFGGLDLSEFRELQRLEGYIKNDPESIAALSRLPPSLTSLDLCGMPPDDEEEAPSHDAWPSFDVPTAACLRQLVNLKDLSLRHFRDVQLEESLPPTVEVLSLECLRPRPPPELPWLARLMWRTETEAFSFSLPPLEPGQQRTLHLQFISNRDYPVQRPTLRLSQLTHAASRLIITASADPPLEGEEEEVAEERQPATLVLVADQPTLRDALADLTASPLESVELEADDVLFADASGASHASSRQVQEYIRHAFGQDWLVLPHEHPEPDVEGREAAEPLPMAGGFTMRRRHALADRS